MTFYRHIIIIPLVGMLTACGGGGGSSTPAEDSRASPSTPQATASIVANPTTVLQGDSVVISWNSSNASSCTASGYWSGTKSTSGNETVEMTSYGDQSFTITCGSASATATVQVNTEDSEGSCVNPHNADIYESYLGKYEMPNPQNTFSDEHVKSIGLKDYGVEWIYGNYKNDGASWIADCSETQYIKLMYRTTLRRLKEHGVTEVNIYNFGYWRAGNVDVWQVAHNTKHLDDWVIEYIVDEAHKLDIDIHYTWQFQTKDTNQNWIFDDFETNGYVRLDMPLLKKIMDTHEEHILWEADRLEQLGVGAISADWSAMWLCFHCGTGDNWNIPQSEIDELKDYYMERQGSIIDQIRGRFSGRIYVGEGPQWNDKRVFDKVDGIILPFGHMFFEDEVATATVDKMQERAMLWIESKFDEWNCLTSQPCWYNTSSTVPPVMFNAFAQSHASFLSNGWKEDGFCTRGTVNGVEYNCMQYEIETDFSAQAIFTEGLFRAVDTQGWFELLGTTTSTGYWLSDTLIPDTQQHSASNTIEGFPNISQSIRGKPAEKLFKYWYTGQYEQYEPTIRQ
jgi:hypothetical protein|tara:strand:+ start:1064 stop:2761 length:1698 start_codon:yes stop_codon:yes gene_type:complete